MKLAARNRSLIWLALASIVVIYLSVQTTESAPASSASEPSQGTNSNNKSAGRVIRSGLLSNLFRRQTSGNGSGSSTSTASSSSGESSEEEPPSQTELEAQKFMDSLPSASANSGPSSFRERVSDTFGLLREGVSNQWRSLRDNWSDTVEDLRDTWTSSQD